MEIIVIYRNGHYFPHNCYAEILASIIGKPSITPAKLLMAEGLGHTVTMIGAAPPPRVPLPVGRPKGPPQAKRPVGRPKGPPKPPQAKRPVGRPKGPPKPPKPPRVSHIPPLRKGSPPGLRGATYAPENGANLHQRQALRVLVGEPFEHLAHGQVYPVALAQGKAVRSHFCGKRGMCGCAKGGVITLAPNEYALPARYLCEFAPDPLRDFT